MKDRNSAFTGHCKSVFLLLFFGSMRLAPGADTTAPTTPTNFSAVVTSCSRVDLNWAPSTDPKGSQSGLAGYKVYRNNALVSTLGLTTTFSDTSLAANAAYTYRVSAVDNSGNESPQSTAASVAPCPDSTAPSIPATLAPTVVSSAQVDLAWSGSIDGSGQGYEAISGLKSYQVFRNGTNANNKIAEIPSTANSYSDTSVSGNSTVYYAVRAVDNSNNVSGFRLSVSVTIPFGAPGSPTSLTGSAPNCRSAHLDWVAPTSVGSGLAYYQVYRNGSPLQQTTATSANDNGVTPGVTYVYTVTAVDTGGRASAPSQSLFVSVSSCPAGPASNLKIDYGNSLARLHWDGTPGTLYQAQCASGFLGPWIPVDAPTTEFVVTNLTAQPSSIYRVAVFTNTPAYLANFITNISDTTPPPTPSNLSLNAVSDTEASLTWDPVVDAGTTDVYGRTYTSGLDRYLIYRDGAFLKNELASATGSSDTTVVTGTTYTYSVASIDKAGNRSGLIGGSVLVRKQCTYGLSYGSATFVSSGGPSNVTVTAGNSCSWAASPGTTWLHSTSSGNGNGTLSYSVDANGTASSRQGTISVGNKTLTITQNGIICSYSLTPSSFNHGSGAESGSFSVTATSGCNWTAATTAGWIHTTSSGSGSGQVNYSVDANGSTSSRSDTITAGGQTFTVTQAGTASTLSLGDALDNTSLIWTSGGDANWIAETSVAFSGGDAAQSGTIGNGQTSWIQTSVTGPVNLSFNWKVSSEAYYDFLHFYVDGVEQTSISGEVDWQSKTFSIASGSHTVQWAYTKDPVCCAGGSDSAWVDQVQITAATCAYSISPGSASYNSAASAGSFSVSAAAGCPWAASPSLGWIHTTSSGSGNGTVSYSVDANPNSTSRSGSIAVGNQTFVINQNANVAPVANAGLDISVTVGATAAFSASGSSDPDGTISSYQWDFGDGTTASGFSVSHIYGLLGVYTVRLTVTDNLGATGTDTALATIVSVADTTPPSVSLTVSGSPNVNGIVNLSAAASDNVGVSKVEFYRDGTLFTTVTTSPYATTFDTRTLANGSHTFLAKAYDAANNNNSSSVSVLVDNTAPSTALTSPANGSTISNTINLTATASDNSGGSGVVRVEFYCDSATTPIGTATIAPYTAPCDTTTLVNGSHSFYSKAYDGAGNSANSASVSATVNNNQTVVSGQSKAAISVGGLTSSDKANILSSGLDGGGSIIVGGWFEGTINCGGTSVTCLNGTFGGAFVAKFNSGGTLAWVKNLSSAQSNVSLSKTVVDHNGDVIVCGYFTGTMDFGGGAHTSAGYEDIFVAKYSGQDGHHLWSKTFGSSTTDIAYGATVDSSNNVVVTGMFNNSINFGGGVLASSGFEDVFLVKFDTNGNYVWSKRFGGTGGDRGLAISADSGGNTVVIGYFTGTVNFGSRTVTASGSKDLFVAKFDSAGSNTWVRTSSGNGTFYPNSLAIGPTGDIAITGSFYGSASLGGNVLVAPYTSAIFIVKYDANSNHLWSEAFGGDANSSDGGNAIAMDSQGDVYVTGIVRDVIDFGGGLLYTSPITVDLFVAKFGSAAGDYRWANRYGGATDYDSGNSISVNESTNDVVVGGKFTGTVNFGGTVGILSAAGGGITDSFILKVQR